MPNKNVSPTRSSAKHSADGAATLSAECKARVRKLYTLTQAEYQRLLFIVRAIVPPQFCDPCDALGHGLLIALQKYTGQGPLTAYVPRCAYLYALQQVKKRRREVQFSELETNAEFEEYLDQVLPYLEDPRYVEAVDELFIRRIEEILAGMYDWHLRHSTQEAIRHATQMVALFRDNANLGKGIGVDEYENTPPAAKKAPGKPTHNTKLVRGLILDRLCDELQADRKDVSSALKALRLSTRQALHEGWLAC
jgi:DNA-directed RNA polymerase specialized sigma24 family protein